MSVAKYWNIDKFIRIGTETYNGMYDYSLIDPDCTIKYYSRVQIKCKACEYVFTTSVYNHINDKQGCPACAKQFICTRAEFIEKATEIHGDKYDYSLIDPVRTIKYYSKVPIRCKTCAYMFIKSVNAHINCKRGCPACDKQFTWTPVIFIEKAIEIHGDKYDYSLIDLNSRITSRIKVSIKCKVCDCVFVQRVSNHISHKHGCANCSKKLPLDPQRFILRATQIHGDKYDYSLIAPTSRIKMISKIHIKCKQCKCVFEQLIKNHIYYKHGCPCCSLERWTSREFIKHATYIHKNRYDYSMIDIDGKIILATKISIRCKICNYIFTLTAHDHMRHKIGCPKCLFPKN